MTISRVKPAGWAFAETLTYSQMNSLDTNVTYAVDGNAGGDKTPTAPINLLGTGGGAGWPIASPAYGINGSTAFPKEVLIGAGGQATSPRWSRTRSIWWQTDITTGGGLYIPIPIVPGALLSSLVLTFHGLAGGTTRGGFPANLPTIYVKYSNHSAPDTDVVMESKAMAQSDFSSTLANYEASWSLTMNNSGSEFETTDFSSDKNYFVQIEGESGANAQSGSLALTRILAYYTPVQVPRV